MQKDYNIINHSREENTYHTQNVVHLLSCNQCNAEHQGQTTFPLHKRIKRG